MKKDTVYIPDFKNVCRIFSKIQSKPLATIFSVATGCHLFLCVLLYSGLLLLLLLNHFYVNFFLKIYFGSGHEVLALAGAISI